jgi:diaminopimelate epimerase
MSRNRKVKFYKMQGSGNDFVVINNEDLKVKLTTDDIKLLADRNYGIGCDQLLLFDIKKSGIVELLIYNKDGSTALNCGNGLRCIGLLLKIQKQTDEVEIKIKGGNKAKTRVLKLLSDTEGEIYTELGEYSMSDNDDGVDVYIGNPHLVIPIDNLSNVDMGYGEYLSKKRDKNISFAQYDDNSAKVRVYERGAGETNACGSAAAAVQLAFMHSKEIDVKFVVSGEIITAGNKTESDGNSISYIKGPAKLLYEGNFFL